MVTQVWVPFPLEVSHLSVRSLRSSFSQTSLLHTYMINIHTPWRALIRSAVHKYQGRHDSGDSGESQSPCWWWVTPTPFQFVVRAHDTTSNNQESPITANNFKWSHRRTWPFSMPRFLLCRRHSFLKCPPWRWWWWLNLHTQLANNPVLSRNRQPIGA